MKRRTLLAGLSAAALGTAAVTLGIRSRQKQRSVVASQIDELSGQHSYDVCIIGSGPAGCVVAQQLLEQNKSVVMLESGVNLTDSKAASLMSQLDQYTNVGEIDYPMVSSRMRAVGGTSNVWTGRCPRLLPSDFAGNPVAPAGGWPIDYGGIKPYYQQAEELLMVAGNELTAGHAPRDKDLPYELDVDLEPLRELLAPLDIRIDAPPTSTTRGKSGPLRVATYMLPELSTQANFTLFTGATATALNSASDGSIQSVAVQSIAGPSKTLRATRYVVACGAVETARLLLLSKSGRYPDGVGNQSGHVGRYFMEHPFLSYSAELPAVKPFENYQYGRTYQYVTTTNGEGLGNLLVAFYVDKYQPNKLKISTGIEMGPEAYNRITLAKDAADHFGNPGAQLSLRLAARDNQLFARGETIARDIFAQLNSGPVKKHEDMHWSHHHMGTTRMHNSDEHGVVNAALQVHGANNLYIASSSVFVTGGVANPTLTLTALALRLGEHLTTV